jgi:hypothetical protein
MRIGFDIDRRFLRFEKELARAADAKAVVRRLRCAADGRPVEIKLTGGESGRAD